MVEPVQYGPVLDAAGAGNALTVTTVDDVEVQPAASVTVTV